jgi:hypothetical protein
MLFSDVTASTSQLAMFWGNVNVSIRVRYVVSNVTDNVFVGYVLE